MPELTSQSTPPPVPPITPGEEEAQSYLRRSLELLWFMEFFLELAKEKLPYPEDAEAMGNGEVPESLAYSLRGSVECALADHVDPLDTLLRKAIVETPGSLVREWQKRQRKVNR